MWSRESLREIFVGNASDEGQFVEVLKGTGRKGVGVSNVRDKGYREAQTFIDSISQHQISVGKLIGEGVLVRGTIEPRMVEPK